MKATFLERKLHTIELLSKLENEGLLSMIEQLLHKSALLDGSVWSSGMPEEEEDEWDDEEILIIRDGLYEA
ncbi:MAG: hypothetical protein IPJ74_01905 [Saprospiraceae bacterium]|nr:hypothetical protein [Saprospiraceae bacterium]